MTDADTINRPTDYAFREAANDLYASECAVEIDAGAKVSVGDDGAWVQAWVFVSETAGLAARQECLSHNDTGRGVCAHCDKVL